MRNLRQYLRAIMGTAIIAVVHYLSVITGTHGILGVGVSTTAIHYLAEAYMTNATGDHPAFSVTKKNTQILLVSMEYEVTAPTISTSI
jgi:hypothetical protein